MKYVLIIAGDSDISTNKIIHWVKYLSDVDFIRINETDKIQITDIHISSEALTRFSIIINQKIQIKSEDILSYWYRRGNLCNNSIGIRHRDSNADDIYKKAFYSSISEFYQYEWEHISAYLHYMLRQLNIVSINSYSDLQSNRLINTEVAKNTGLEIPDTIVSNSVESITRFLHKHKKVITKCIYFPGLKKEVEQETIFYGMNTNVFTIAHLEEETKKHKAFQPTLFQEYIEKEFEIRTFFTKEKTYSMAIFSQNNQQTAIDFRNYDSDKPNRNIPFILPADIEYKIKKLMQILDYDTGSIDIIYNKGKYYFLEINTTGQFDWVSGQCNYIIEKQIANTLLSCQ